MALTPSREAIVSSCDLVRPVEMTTVPLVVNRVFSGVKARVAAEPPRRQKIVRTAFAVARRRNKLVEAGEPVPLLLKLQFFLCDMIVLSKIRRRVLGGRLEFLSAGGGKTSMEVLEFFEDLGLPLCEGYGMTEAAPIITLSTSPGFSRRRLGSVGKPLPGCTVEIRDPDTLEVMPAGRQGEIFAAGDNIAVGYHNQPEATAETFLVDPSSGRRFLRTGDLGYVDTEGYLYISGRIKEQYKLQNGKFVSPSVLEDFYNRSVFIAQTVVCGADREYNVALIAPELTELRLWARERGIPFPTSPSEYPAFYSLSSVQSLFSQELRAVESEINPYERVRRWAFIEALTPENDLLTQKLSLKRHNIAREHGDVIEGLYAGRLGHSQSHEE